MSQINLSEEKREIDLRAFSSSLIQVFQTINFTALPHTSPSRSDSHWGNLGAWCFLECRSVGIGLGF